MGGGADPFFTQHFCNYYLTTIGVGEEFEYVSREKDFA